VVVRGNELWLFGGRVEMVDVKTKKKTLTSNMDAYIYSMKTQEWSVEPNVLGDGMARDKGVSALCYKDLCCVIGGGIYKGIGWDRTWIPSPDVVFDVVDGHFVSLPERPRWRDMVTAKTVLVGSCLIVLAFARSCVSPSGLGVFLH